MLIHELYDHFGSWTKVCRELNFGNSTYQGWRKKGFIPFKTQLLIENKTKGLFKASEEHAKHIDERDQATASRN